MRTRAAALAAALVLAAAIAGAQAMSVTVKETPVRATPSFLGKVAGTLAYGDQVQVLETKTGWARVAGKPAGWVNLSALTEKKIVLKSGASNVEQSASSGEVALAGKGFNADVEAEYRQDSKLDYAWVDRMEKAVVTPEELSAFIARGGLSTPGGEE
jgi:hypothetical protein